MFNPLLNDFSNLKDSELESRVSDLNKKYNIALRMGNGSLAFQISIIIASLKDETIRRQNEATKKLMQKQNKDLDGLINID